MQKFASWFGASSPADLAAKYPNSISDKDALEAILRDIGLAIIKFPKVRQKSPLLPTNYHVSAPNVPNPPSTSTPNAAQPPNAGNTGTSTQSGGTGGASAGSPSQKPAATAIGDPKSVNKALKKFKPKGNNREKVVTLLKEAQELDIQNTPLAFCFLLRSMFEISAKAYCGDHASAGLATALPNGQDKKLVTVLKEIATHLASSSNDPAIKKVLHGASTELNKPESVLSVTSMNQLVHNPQFSVTAADVSTVFSNVFPLLEAMNQ